MHLFSAYGKVRKLTPKGRMEGEDNVRFWYTALNQTIGDTFFGSIVLNPDLARFDINMEQASVNTLILIPPHSHKLVMVAIGIDNLLDINLTERRAVAAVLIQNVADILAILA
jgi:hypothetical protein